jgi:LysR family glycine cleavage system transcriptional activator
MKRRLPPLKTLPAFELAADHLSLSKAADELFLTHGAISRQVKVLETHLGTPLFHRHNRRIELTQAGTDFLSTVRLALDLIEAGAARVTKASRQGPVVVSCLPTFMMRWLIPRLYDFNARHSDIEIRLSASPGPADFERGGVDVAIRLDDAPWPNDAVAYPFLKEEVGPVCSPALLERQLVTVAADLRHHPILHTDTRPHAWEQWMAAAAVGDLTPDRGTRFEHFYFMLEAAAAGLGTAIAPYPLAAADIATGRLVAPLGFVPSGQTYHVVRPQSAAGDSAVAAFTAWLVNMASDRSFPPRTSAGTGSPAPE